MIASIDLETDGLVTWKKPWTDSCQPHILSVGVVAFTDDGSQEVQSLYSIIKPEGFVIDNNCEAVKINGITQELAMSCGIRYRAALQALNHICYNSRRIIIYNAKFEAAMLEIERHRLGKDATTQMVTPDKTRCLMLAMSEIIGEPGLYHGEYKYKNFGVAYKHVFGVEPESQHHALHDARQAAWLTFELLKQGLWSLD